MRLSTFLGLETIFLKSVDFDEGVYFAAAHLMGQSVRPYVDFQFAHPPGLPRLLSALMSVLPASDLATSFAVAKLAASVVGGLCAAGVGIIGARIAGLGVGWVAGLMYASFPEAIMAERGVFLEPWVNGCGLGAYILLMKSALHPHLSPMRRGWLGQEGVRWLIGGFLLGTAALIKVTGVLWILGIFFLLPPTGKGRCFLWGVVGGLCAALTFLTPILRAGGPEFFQQVILFQLVRPADGDVDLTTRLMSLWGPRHLEWDILIATALCGWGLRIDRRLSWCGPFFVVGLAYALLFLTAKSFWSQYNAGIAPFMALLAGLGTVSLGVIFKTKPWGVWIRTGILIVLVGMPLRGAWKVGRGLDPEQWDHVSAIRAAVKDDGCLFVFEPAWQIMANISWHGCRTPPYVIDPYMVMIRDGLRSGRTFDHVQSLWPVPESQTTVMTAIEQAHYLFLGPRGDMQLSGASNEKVAALFVPSQFAGVLTRRFW